MFSIHSQSTDVPQGNILDPILYSLYIVHVPIYHTTTITKLADDRCMLSVNNEPFTVFQTLQPYISCLEE